MCGLRALLTSDGAVNPFEPFTVRKTSEILKKITQWHFATEQVFIRSYGTIGSRHLGSTQL